MERNYTEGSVPKSILRFSLPYLLSYFLQTLYGMADLFIIGQYENVAGTTAVSIGSQVMHMLTVMIVGLAMGSTVTIGPGGGWPGLPANGGEYRQHHRAVYGAFRGADGGTACVRGAHRGGHVHAGGGRGGGPAVSHRLLSGHSLYYCL